MPELAESKGAAVELLEVAATYLDECKRSIIGQRFVEADGWHHALKDAVGELEDVVGELSADQRKAACERSGARAQT